MFTTFRIATALISLVTVPTHADHHSALRLVITGETAAEQTATRHTLAIVAEAGLRLPPLEIHRHETYGPCHGFEGWHRTVGDRSVIDICTFSKGEFEQRTLLHELGHAWTEHFLPDANKRAFQRLRNWTTWNDYRQAKWEDNGAEQAAEIFTWALSDHPVGVVKIRPNSCTDLHDGYVALTGKQPLHGFTRFCTVAVTKATRS